MPTEGSTVTVSKFAVGQPDQKRVVSNKVDDVIRAIVELGGTYPDVVLALQQAKTSRSLLGRFEVDAIPDTGRTYHQKDGDDEESDGDGSKSPIRCRNCSRAAARRSSPQPVRSCRIAGLSGNSAMRAADNLA